MKTKCKFTIATYILKKFKIFSTFLKLRMKYSGDKKFFFYNEFINDYIFLILIAVSLPLFSPISNETASPSFRVSIPEASSAFTVSYTHLRAHETLR